MLSRTNFIRALGIGFTFFGAFVLNYYLFAYLTLDDYASLIFIPAGLRLFFVIIYRWQAIPGLVLGSALASCWSGHFESNTLILFTAIASSLNAMIALIIYEKISSSFNRQLNDLGLKNLVGMAITQALLGTLMHHALYVTYGILTTLSVVHFYTMFFGDLLGILLLMTITVIFFKAVIKTYPNKS